MSITKDMNFLTNEFTVIDWAQKLHFTNKIELTHQSGGHGDSTKIEIDDIPTHLLPASSTLSSSPKRMTPPSINIHSSPTSPTSPTSDSYLSTIIGSQTKKTPFVTSPTTPTTPTTCNGSQECPCYKCKRQRRRIELKTKLAGQTPVPMRSNSVLVSSASKTLSPISIHRSRSSLSVNNNTIYATKTSVSSPQLIPQPAAKTLSSITRKRPDIAAIDRKIPKITYALQDSIYGVNLQSHSQENESTKTLSEEPENKKSNRRSDDYRISWRDEGGNDILTSLKTFQSIFEEKGENEVDGLSDLLEQRAKELKAKQEIPKAPTEKKTQKVSRRSDCLTLSFREGPRHKQITFHQTMELPQSKARMDTYDKAFVNCTKANSGLSIWLKRQPNKEPTREVKNSSSYQPRKSHKRLLNAMLPSSRKNKVGMTDDLFLQSSGVLDSPSQLKATSPTTAVPTDILSVAHALLPNQSLAFMNSTHRASSPDIKSYEHIDRPGKPIVPHHSQSFTYRSSSSIQEGKTQRPHSPYKALSLSERDLSKDSSSVSSGSIEEEPKMSISTRLLATFNRKTARAQVNSPSSVHFVDSWDNSKVAVSVTPDIAKSPTDPDATTSVEIEKSLDDLCKILPHIKRSTLAGYIVEANGDYMKALLLCRHAVTTGRL
ncbi:hypothetical protein BDF14DRAFT_1878984 [Spinellus fusiger]|nr:hypothetical protein BDF14DRAFT_1878984 [Spinellus fusiger]